MIIILFINEDDNISNETNDGKCIRCGKCCTSYLPLTKKELHIIKQYVKENNIQAENRLLPNGDYETRCPFYNISEHKCNIYEVRPFACRDFKCDHKDWKKRRKLYAERADFNGIKKGKAKKLSTMQDLIYDDFELLVRTIANMSIKDGGVDYDLFVEALKNADREELLKYMKFEFEKEGEKDV